jgi:glycosyltransferase Alg8
MSTSLVLGFKTNSTVIDKLGYSLLLFIVLATASFVVLTYQDQFPDRSLWFAIGIIGIWRYSWKALHTLRAFYYQHIYYPKLRMATRHAEKPSQLLVVVPSYQTDSVISYTVYKRLFDELEKFGVESKVAACISDPADIEVVNRAKAGRDISIYFLPQNGQGKRVAMVKALQLFYNEGYHSDAQLLLMDGDTVVSDNIFIKCCSFISKFKDLGAVTCNNTPQVKGSALTCQWYRQRMAMRHFYMSSLSLSHQLLVLTGRFSLFRANTLLNKEFIHILEHDIIDHWRYGKLKMLTGDDKSTWFHLLKYEWKMLYLPDVETYCLEDAPFTNFLTSSISLMKRWYGNMLRNNGRALKLGPKKCGKFLWICLVDQKISMWTTLSGPLFIFLLALTYTPAVFAAYIVWVIIGRGIISLVNWLLTGKFHPVFIFLLWYEQIIGSVLKVYILFRLDRQKWTRQAIQSGGGHRNLFVHTILPRLMTATSLTALFLSLALFHGIISIPTM